METIWMVLAVVLAMGWLSSKFQVPSSKEAPRWVVKWNVIQALRGMWRGVCEYCVALRVRRVWRFVPLGALAILMLGAAIGCNTVRKGVGLVDSGASAVFAVKDDVIGAVKTIIDSAESIKDSIKSNTVKTAAAVTP